MVNRFAFKFRGPLPFKDPRVFTYVNAYENASKIAPDVLLAPECLAISLATK